MSPVDKIAYLERLAREGWTVCMVGDGINDTPALAAVEVSMSPASAVDISQTAADILFQGEGLSGVPLALRIAVRANRLVKQNFGMAFSYNLLTVPLVVAGLVTPLIAAAAMFASSIVVVLNALRQGWRR